MERVDSGHIQHSDDKLRMAALVLFPWLVNPIPRLFFLSIVFNLFFRRALLLENFQVKLLDFSFRQNYRKADGSIQVKRLVLNIWNSNFIAGNRNFFSIISKPSVLNDVDQLNLEGVKMVIYRDKELLME
jgi:hypothetical protein